MPAVRTARVSETSRALIIAHDSHLTAGTEQEIDERTTLLEEALALSETFAAENAAKKGESGEGQYPRCRSARGGGSAHGRLP